MARLLLVSPEPRMREALASSPLLEGHTIDVATGDLVALRRLRRVGYDVVLTSPATSIDEDVEFVEEARRVRPGIRAIALATESSPGEVISALRASVFACFTAPFDASEIADMTARALAEPPSWKDGIHVVSANEDWISLRVNCRLLTAERLVTFLEELSKELAEPDRDALLLAFREILMNAMEHGGHFDPGQVVEVSAIRTARTIVYYVKDPGPGFDRDGLAHAAVSNPADDPVAHIAARAEQGLRPGGFGLLLARKVVDELIYSERGNEVLLIKYRA
jgi:anti-sigma regulatory factor (Ser/Thr protein kinase)/CheY-like chemotaxis protein